MPRTYREADDGGGGDGARWTGAALGGALDRSDGSWWTRRAGAAERRKKGACRTRRTPAQFRRMDPARVHILARRTGLDAARVRVGLARRIHISASAHGARAAQSGGRIDVIVQSAAREQDARLGYERGRGLVLRVGDRAHHADGRIQVLVSKRRIEQVGEERAAEYARQRIARADAITTAGRG